MRQAATAAVQARHRLWVAGAALVAMLAVGLGSWAWLSADPPGDRPMAALPPGDGPLRIVAFGTSLTAGNDWPARLEATLAACLARPVTLVRIARPGASTDWALAQTARVIAARPDLVLIEFAINDTNPRNGIGLRRSIAQHDALITALRAGLPEARLVLMTMNPVAGLHRVLRARLAQYYASYGTLAERHDTGLLDMTARWPARPARSDLPDGLHPTDAAAARIMVPALAQAIATAAGRTSCPARPAGEATGRAATGLFHAPRPG